MSQFERLVLKALIQILRGVSSIVFYKNEKVSDECDKVANEIQSTLDNSSMF